MSDNEKKYTQREMVLAQRKAFEAGSVLTTSSAKKLAKERYPMPPLMLGKYAGREYRLRDGVLEYQTRTQTPILGGEITDRGGAWDRATLQPEDVHFLAAARVPE